MVKADKVKTAKLKTTKVKTAKVKTAKVKAATKTAAKKETAAKMKAPAKSLLHAEVPTFEILSSSGKNVQLTQFKGKKVVLYFYPKDNTPGCTLESHAFNRLLPEFEKLNTVILGVSRDNLKSHNNFIEKCGFQFELLSDGDEKLCHFFDVIKEKNMYGKKVMGIERSTFVIDENSRISKEYRKVQADGHAEKVLEDLKQG